MIHWLGAQWDDIIASLGFGVALWALIESKHVARRQATADLRSQATQVVVLPLQLQEPADQPGKIRLIARVHNYSAYPVQEVWLTVHSRMIHTREHPSTFAQQLAPNVELILNQIVDAGPDPMAMS